LHLCCITNQRFTTTNSINRDEATFQAPSIVTLSQTPSTVTLSRDCKCQPLLSFHCRKQNKASFHCKEEDKLLHPCKKSKQAITHASTTEYFLVFLVLSYSDVYVYYNLLELKSHDVSVWPKMYWRSSGWRFSVAVTRWSRSTQLLYIEPG